MSNRRGFTLLEVLVALTILAVALGTVLRITQQGITATAGRERQILLDQLAETVLNAHRLGVADDLGTEILPLPEGVTWQVDRRQLRDANIQNLDPELYNLAEGLVLVRVVVESALGGRAVLESVVREAS